MYILIKCGTIHFTALMEILALVTVNGFRSNVGMVLVHPDGRLFWGRRRDGVGWQFPQGGIDGKEKPEEAMFRELFEETGLKSEHVEILGQTKDWLKYELPGSVARRLGWFRIKGQRQKWFLLRVLNGDDDINLNATRNPEFDHWQWVSYWYPIEAVVHFKQQVYRQVLIQLAPLVMGR